MPCNSFDRRVHSCPEKVFRGVVQTRTCGEMVNRMQLLVFTCTISPHLLLDLLLGPVATAYGCGELPVKSLSESARVSPN